MNYCVRSVNFILCSRSIVADENKDYLVDIIEIRSLIHGELATIRGIIESYSDTDSDAKPVQKTLAGYGKD